MVSFVLKRRRRRLNPSDVDVFAGVIVLLSLPKIVGAGPAAAVPR
jgi:hypothetical protein